MFDEPEPGRDVAISSYIMLFYTMTYQEVFGHETMCLLIQKLGTLLALFLEQHQQAAIMREREASMTTSTSQMYDSLAAATSTTPTETEHPYRLALAQALDTLPETAKIVLALHYAEQLNMAEIAQVLELPLDHVIHLHTQAIMSVQDTLQGAWDEATMALA